MPAHALVQSGDLSKEPNRSRMNFSFTRFGRDNSGTSPCWLFLGVQIAGLLHPGEIEACGRKFLRFQVRSTADLHLKT